MTIQSGFFNSINGDRKYSATNFAEYFASFIGNGVFPDPSSGLQVVESENMNIVVKAGKGWINGYFVVNDSDYTLTLDNADGVLKRIDRVVMRLNYLTRQIEIDVKKGAFASNPVAPTLQRDADMHELALADILINNGATTITQVNITDTRFNSSLCGIVKGLIDEIDTTNLFAQYDASFTSWFESLQVILEGDVATNLASAIGDLNTLKTNNKTNLVSSINEVFLGYSSKLSDMVDALLLITPSLPLNSNSTMQDVLAVLESGDVGGGKKYVEGTITSSNANLNVVNGNGTVVAQSAITFDFSILEFIPTYVIFRPINKDVNAGFTVWCATDILNVNSGAFKGNVVVGSESSTWLYRQPYVNGVANIRIGLTNTQYEFLAIE